MIHRRNFFFFFFSFTYAYKCFVRGFPPRNPMIMQMQELISVMDLIGATAAGSCRFFLLASYFLSFGRNFYVVSGCVMREWELVPVRSSC